MSKLEDPALKQPTYALNTQQLNFPEALSSSTHGTETKMEKVEPIQCGFTHFGTPRINVKITIVKKYTSSISQKALFIYKLTSLNYRL